jgi:undecaprenyl pyrophosphate synthase
MITGSLSGPSRAHDTFILPELKEPRREALRVLVLPDGNKRSDPLKGGYAKGAKKVVEIAEHLARRADVAVMVACVLSPENVAARSDELFAGLQRGFAHLGAEIAEKGTLIGSGIRAELCGDLTALRARRGSAAALADAIEAVIEQTSRVTAPALRLFFGVNYRSTTPRDMDLDIVLRTGIEGEGALRLSGLSSHPSIANFAMTKLWPDVTTSDIDEVILAATRRRGPSFSTGYSPAAIVELVRALARAPLDAPVRATLATHASPQAMNDALVSLYRDAPPERRTIAVRCGSRVHGRRVGAQHEIVVLIGEQRGELPGLRRRGYTSMLAPGQRYPLLLLPEQHYGYATIHACEATPAGIVEGLRAATRFSATHVALFGAERPLGVPVAAAGRALSLR